MSGFEARHPRTAAGSSDGGQFAVRQRADSAVRLARSGVSPDPFSDDTFAHAGQLLDALHARCLDLMAEQGLDGWQLEYTAVVSNTLGQTIFGRRTIVLNAPQMVALNGAERLDTIRHEMAHALLPADAQHGPEWRRKARELGARPVPSIRENVGASDEDFPVVGRCPAGHTFGRSRMPASRSRLYCRKCPGPIGDQRAITWRQSNTRTDPQVVAAVARHAAVRPAVRLVSGDTVTVRPLGTKFDGQRGHVVSVGRTNVVIRMSTGRLMKAPVEAIEVDA